MKHGASSDGDGSMDHAALGGSPHASPPKPHRRHGPRTSPEASGLRAAPGDGRHDDLSIASSGMAMLPRARTAASRGGSRPTSSGFGGARAGLPARTGSGAGTAALYKFVVMRGNYSHLIREGLQRRGWWQEIPNEGVASHRHRRIDHGAAEGGGDTSNADGGRSPQRPPVASQARSIVAKGFNFCWRPGNFVNCQHASWNTGGVKQQVNHFEFIKPLCTKHGLRQSLVDYYKALSVPPWRFIPPTYCLESGGMYSSDMVQFKRLYSEIAKGHKQQCLDMKHCAQNVWMVKPVASNQGRGIELYSQLNEVLAHVQSVANAKWVVQKYIERPMLIHRRKFDIRVWALVTPSLDLYLYREGYLRTSSEEYTFDLAKSYVHLTNHCLQKHSPDLGKHEEGNTLNFEQFQQYLDEHVPSARLDFRKHLWPRIKECIVDSFLAVKTALNANSREHCFELFGYDFLVDEDMRVWLLEVNTNPYLGAQNSWHEALLPAMVDDMLKLVTDPVFPPPPGVAHGGVGFQHEKQVASKAPDENWFDLILPSSVPHINVCTSVNSLYPSSVLDTLPQPPRPPRRTQRGTKRPGKLDVNPYRGVNVYVPPDDYVRPSIEFDAGTAIRSAPPTLPTSASPARRQPTSAVPTHLYPGPSAGGSRGTRNADSSDAGSDSDDDDGCGNRPLDIPRSAAMPSAAARARARARAQAVAAEVALKKKQADEAEAAEAEAVLAQAAAKRASGSGSDTNGDDDGASRNGHSSSRGSSGGSGGVGSGGGGAARGAGARHASSLVSMVNEVRRSQAHAALTHTRATALRAVLSAALPRNRPHARARRVDKAPADGQADGRGGDGGDEVTPVPTGRRQLTQEEKRIRDECIQERLTYALYILLLLSCNEQCRGRIVAERLVPLVVAVARGKSRHARDGLLRTTALRVLANMCTSMASRAQLVHDGIVPPLVDAAMSVQTRQPLYAAPPTPMLPAPASPPPTDTAKGGGKDGDSDAPKDAATPVVATGPEHSIVGAPPGRLLATELGVRMTNDMLAFKNAMPAPIAAVRALGSLLRPSTMGAVGSASGLGSMSSSRFSPAASFTSAGGSRWSSHSPAGGGGGNTPTWRQSLVADGALDVLLLLAGQGIEVQHLTDVGVPPPPPPPRSTTPATKFRPVPIPINAGGSSPYASTGEPVVLPTAPPRGSGQSVRLFEVLRSTKIEATQALQLVSTPELMHRQAKAPEAFECVSLAQRNAQLCVLSTLGHELDNRQRLALHTLGPRRVPHARSFSHGGRDDRLSRVGVDGASGTHVVGLHGQRSRPGHAKGEHGQQGRGQRRVQRAASGHANSAGWVLEAPPGLGSDGSLGMAWPEQGRGGGAEHSGDAAGTTLWHASTPKRLLQQQIRQYHQQQAKLFAGNPTQRSASTSQHDVADSRGSSTTNADGAAAAASGGQHHRSKVHLVQLQVHNSAAGKPSRADRTRVGARSGFSTLPRSSRTVRQATRASESPPRVSHAANGGHHRRQRSADAAHPSTAAAPHARRPGLRLKSPRLQLVSKQSVSPSRGHGQPLKPLHSPLKPMSATRSAGLSGTLGIAPTRDRAGPQSDSDAARTQLASSKAHRPRTTSAVPPYRRTTAALGSVGGNGPQQGRRASEAAAQSPTQRRQRA